MALSLDDKLLGEKTHYYCSSSEDEGEEGSEGDEGSEDEDGGKRGAASEKAPPSLPEPQLKEYSGRSTNVSHILLPSWLWLNSFISFIYKL